jgi:hypothetical protein
MVPINKVRVESVRRGLCERHRGSCPPRKISVLSLCVDTCTRNAIGQVTLSTYLTSPHLLNLKKFLVEEYLPSYFFSLFTALFLLELKSIFRALKRHFLPLFYCPSPRNMLLIGQRKLESIYTGLDTKVGLMLSPTLNFLPASIIVHKLFK